MLGSRASRMNRRPTVRMTDPVDALVRFAAFELDLRTGELRKSGIRIHLPDQPFQVLRTLLDRPGDLVTREELRQRLWAAETFVDFERGLNAAVRRLRDALGDSADVPRFVETLPRRGYRFIAPVSRQPAARESRAARSRDRGRSHPDTRHHGGPAADSQVGSDVNRRHGRGVRGRSLGIGFFPNVSGASIASSHRPLHAGGASLPEHDGRSRSGVHQRRDD